MVPETELVPEIRKTGHRLADLAVAFSALFVSLCSLGIALHHGRTMQRLVEANSRPFIQITTSNVAPSYLKAGSEQTVLRWPRTASNASIWDKDAVAGSNRVKFEACYCSIFDECWIENSHTFRPTAVASCG